MFLVEDYAPRGIQDLLIKRTLQVGLNTPLHSGETKAEQRRTEGQDYGVVNVETADQTD